MMEECNYNRIERAMEPEKVLWSHDGLGVRVHHSDSLETFKNFPSTSDSPEYVALEI